VEFTIDINDICYVHIDKKKKFPATALLRAFGYGTTPTSTGSSSRRGPKVGDEDKLAEAAAHSGPVLAEDIVDPRPAKSSSRSRPRSTRTVIGRLERPRSRRSRSTSARWTARGESPIIKNT
jgi:DNA-directed RNA polymerase beta subunit